MKHMVPAQLANLRPPFNGRPGPGRPKGSLDFNNRVRNALLAQIKTGQFKGQQIIDVFVEVMKRQLLKGDVQWAKFVIDRLEPMMTDARQALGVQINVNTETHGDIKRLTPAERDEFERLTRKYEGLSQETVIDVPASEIVNATPAGA
jgi:hypothetical protein